MKYEPKEVTLTLDQLKALCAEWQGILRLHDWDITLALAEQQDFDKNTRVGDSAVMQEEQWAHIRLLRPGHYRADNLEPYDMEQTLVHELLHIYENPFCEPSGDPSHAPKERMVERLAQALVALKRAAQRPPEVQHIELAYRTDGQQAETYGAPV